MTNHRIHDTDLTVRISEHQTVFHGAIWDIHRDTFTIAETDEAMTREYIQHPGAVAIVAIDQHHNVAMIHQYRHPVGQNCWEIPAGLRDVEGESRIATAQRELAEEADLVAADWSVLVDHYPSSGSSSEAIRIFLAQDVEAVPAQQRHIRDAEEAHIVIQWVPLPEVLDAVLAGDIRNSNAVAGIMAAHLVLQGTRQARPIDAGWNGSDA